MTFALKLLLYLPKYHLFFGSPPASNCASLLSPLLASFPFKSETSLGRVLSLVPSFFHSLPRGLLYYNDLNSHWHAGKSSVLLFSPDLVLDLRRPCLLSRGNFLLHFSSNTLGKSILIFQQFLLLFNWLWAPRGYWSFLFSLSMVWTQHSASLAFSNRCLLIVSWIKEWMCLAFSLSIGSGFTCSCLQQNFL